MDKEAWEGVQRTLKELKINNQIFNEVLNEFVRGQYRILRELKTKTEAGEKVTLANVLQIMGRILAELESDQLRLRP